MKNKLIFTGYEWDASIVEKLWTVIDRIGKEDLGLDYYPPQFEIVTAEQMLDAYSSIGMPIYYNHWSFGKNFLKNHEDYKKGRMNLAYEMVINSNPCIAYLMENNSATVTALVMAHANCGHAHYFKNNYLYRNTNPNIIIDFLDYAKNFIFDCEEKYGSKECERLIDVVKIIAKYGINKYPTKYIKNKKEKEKDRLEKILNDKKMFNYDLEKSSPNKYFDLNEVYRDISESFKESIYPAIISFKEENILQFIINYSLNLKDWQKEIIRILMKIEQYFYPQTQDKIMNEGFACFVHYHIMFKLYEQGYISNGSFLEFLQLHTSVCHQPPMAYLNHYALGFKMFMDIKRACENPDAEDYKWMPTIAGQKDYMKVIKEIIKYYKDSSFVLQFLSPKVIRELGLFSILETDKMLNKLKITGIQSDSDILYIREKLSEQVDIDNFVPSLEIVKLDKLANIIFMRYTPYKDRKLYDPKKLTDIIKTLTGYKVELDINYV